jgi:hypothetical protein
MTQPVSRSFQITPGRGEVEVINQIGTIRIISTDPEADRVSIRAKRLERRFKYLHPAESDCGKVDGRGVARDSRD